jgi:NADH-quinone oxidoreductase subunit J
VAGLESAAEAEFLFAVQIILYIGGIMVLFLFVIMLVNLDEQAKERQFTRQWWIALACIGPCVGAQVFYFLRKGSASFQLANRRIWPMPPRGTRS